MTKNKIIFTTIAWLAAAIALNACTTTQKEEKVTQDCSAIFETKTLGGKTSKAKKYQEDENSQSAQDQEQQGPRECKVLEFKFDKNTKCELVGSDKIDDLSKAISEDKADKVILIAPTKQVKDLSNLAEKYLAYKGFDIEEHFQSDIFKSLDFPYKGMRCSVAKKEVVVWSGDNKFILTIK